MENKGVWNGVHFNDEAIKEWQKKKRDDNNNFERDKGERRAEAELLEERQMPLKYVDVEVTPDKEAILNLVPVSQGFCPPPP